MNNLIVVNFVLSLLLRQMPIMQMVLRNCFDHTGFMAINVPFGRLEGQPVLRQRFSNPHLSPTPLKPADYILTEVLSAITLPVLLWTKPEITGQWSNDFAS